MISAKNLIKFYNFDLLDVENGVLVSDCEVLVEGNKITAISKSKTNTKGAKLIDLGGRVLMPGLIDCHVHVTAEGMTSYPQMLPSLSTAQAVGVMEGMLMRGYTTVRDAGGADYGHKLAVEQGLINGPRMFVSGSPISQTAGHGDWRDFGDTAPPCACASLIGQYEIADGVPEILKAVRTQCLRRVDQIKIMASGGVSSPSDPIENVQFTMDELRAAVDEATRARRYVLAHAYSAAAISRATEAGVRSIEHGNLLNDKVAKQMAAAGNFLTPTLVTYRKALEHGLEEGMTEEQVEKASQVADAGLESIAIAKKYAVPMAFGSDLFLTPHKYQSQEFEIRKEVLPAIDILRSATLVGADLVRMKDQLGVLKVGAFADLIVLEGNPLEDFSVFQQNGKHVALVMQNGVVKKNKL